MMTPKDINRNALYVLTSDANGRLDTGYLPIDKSLLQEISLDKFNSALSDNSYLRDEKLSNTEKIDLHVAKQRAVIDFYTDLFRRYPFLFTTRDYCESLGSVSEFRGLSSVERLKRKAFSEYGSLFEIDHYRSDGILPSSYNADGIKRFTQTFFDAYFIQETYKKCDADNETIKAYSHRRLGWQAFEHRLNDDLTATICTNFGYGSSTYFSVTLTYKGIKVIPYSRWVHYRYANTYQILKYTREYYPCNENWEAVLDFVKAACNGLLDEGNDSFVTKYMKSECEELTKRLVEYMDTNTFRIHEWIDGQYSWPKDGPTITLSGYDLTVFRADKVSGALDFVNSIRSLDQLFPTQCYLDVIRNCGEQALPQLTHDIDQVDKDIARFEVDFILKCKARDEAEVALNAIKPTNDATPEQAKVIYESEEYKKCHKVYGDICACCYSITKEIDLHKRYKCDMERFRDKIGEQLLL